MGVLPRAHSLPSMGQLAVMTQDLDLSRITADKVVQECDIASITSQPSIDDLLQTIQKKLGSRGATVHGTNVWATLKAASDARALEVNLPIYALDLDQAEQESADLWYWPLDDVASAQEASEAAAAERDDWCWVPDKRLSMIERIEQRIADAMWDWKGATIPTTLEQEEAVPTLDDDGMWDWSWEKPRDKTVLSNLLWDWSWAPTRTSCVGDGVEERRTNAEKDLRAGLIWDWGWRRDDTIDPKPTPGAPDMTPPNVVEPEGDSMWDWAWEVPRRDKLSNFLWDWSWEPTSAGWIQM